MTIDDPNADDDPESESLNISEEIINDDPKLFHEGISPFSFKNWNDKNHLNFRPGRMHDIAEYIPKFLG